MFRCICNNEDDLIFLQSFLNNAGSSLATFRYFQNRSLDSIKDHLLTVLIIQDDIPVAYGHLDPDKDKIWLGICVAEGAQGKGYGFEMMNYLTEAGRKKNLKQITLKVDADNIPGISLYRKIGFINSYIEPGKYYIMTLDLYNE